MKNNIIKPELASGFRDYLPEEMIPRQEMMDTIRAVFERFGFAPLETPIIEKEKILTGGDAEFNKQIFRIASNKKDKKEDVSGLALRFDLTVPLARVVASNSTLSRPFKRYQMGKVFRAESAQMGRYKEFMQCDADIVGSESVMADAEVIALVYETLIALGISDFTIKINDRKVLNEVFSKAEVPAGKSDAVLRIIDKLDKIGGKGVEKQLSELLGGRTTEKVLAGLKNISSDSFGRISKDLSYLGIPESMWAVDSNIARGLGYYTGIVFETILNDMPEIGSVCSGGRYDGLVEKFSKDKVPAVGMSIGIDRLFVALEKLNKIKKKQTVADVLVLNFDSICEERVQNVASNLRKNGIKTEIYLGRENTFKGQLSYAVSREYPVVVIIGPKELAKNVAQVKDMKAREQKEVAFNSVVETVKGLIG